MSKKPEGVFRRLADGSWGIHAPLRVLKEGSVIAMTKHSTGEVAEVFVGKVIWRGKKYGLARVGEEPPKELLA